MVLAYNISERFRPQPVGQRPRRVFFKPSRFEQIGHART
jgi:hypothetical protein